MKNRLRGRHLISLDDWSTQEIDAVMDVSSELKRLRANSFKALLPGVESWYDLGNKSKTIVGRPTQFALNTVSDKERADGPRTVRFDQYPDSAGGARFCLEPASCAGRQRRQRGQIERRCSVRRR